jgi:hypothetical protein
MSKKIELLKDITYARFGMDDSDFELSISYWQERVYKKGEFYNEYKNVCRNLGFVTDGLFRIYKHHENSRLERNIIFFTNNQFVSSLKSFVTQASCEYYTKSMAKSEILYIHYDHLHELYFFSPARQKSGRIFAESALHAVTVKIEGLLFKTPHERYLEMIEQRPNVMQSALLCHTASYLGIEGPAIQSRIISASAVKSVYQLNTSHSPFLSKPNSLSILLSQIAREIKKSNETDQGLNNRIFCEKGIPHISINKNKT